MAVTIRTIDGNELARLMYLLHQALEDARDLQPDDEPAPNASDRIEIALTEARKILRLVGTRRGAIA